MRNTILLFIFLIVTISCTRDKGMIKKDDLIGQWKEIQRRNSKKMPAFNVSDCKGMAKGETYTFNSDNIYTVKGYCPENKESETKGIWLYHDSVLSIIRDSVNWKFSVSDEGSNKIKFSVISADINGKSNVDWFITESYMILEKQ